MYQYYDDDLGCFFSYLSPMRAVESFVSLGTQRKLQAVYMPIELGNLMSKVIPSIFTISINTRCKQLASLNFLIFLNMQNFSLSVPKFFFSQELNQQYPYIYFTQFFSQFTVSLCIPSCRRSLLYLQLQSNWRDSSRHKYWSNSSLHLFLQNYLIPKFILKVLEGLNLFHHLILCVGHVCIIVLRHCMSTLL